MFSLLNNFFKEEDGLGTVEIVIIVAILVGIALIFRTAIIDFVKGILGQIFNSDIKDKVNPSKMQ